MVTILSVGFTLPTGTEHERTSPPLMCTEQAPHWATPQPYLVPVSPTCSRITHKRGVSASTCTSRTLPFTFSFAMKSSCGFASAWPEVAIGLREQAVEGRGRVDHTSDDAGAVALEPVAV